MMTIPTAIRDERPGLQILDAAIALVRDGNPIFPCSASTKAPLTQHGFKDATTDEATVRGWSHSPNAMIGMPTGSITDVFVIDLDTKGDGLQRFANLCDGHGGEPVTLTASVLPASYKSPHRQLGWQTGRRYRRAWTGWFLSRILVSAPASLSGTRLWRDPEPSDLAAIAAYVHHLHELLSMPWPLAEGKRNELRPRELPLSIEAAAALRAFSDHLERQCGAEGDLAPIRDFAAKAAEHAARIAGVLTIIEEPLAREIREDAIAWGISLAEWYVMEALRLHAAARTDPKLARAQRLLDWMRRQAEPNVKFRDILRCGPTELREKRPAEETIRVLIEHGLVFEVSSRPLAYRIADGLPS